MGSLFGRAAGAREGFDFSDVFEAADFIWTPDRLAEWMRDPDGFLPGNTMLLPEAVPEQDIAPLVAYVAVRTGSATWDVEQVKGPDTTDMGELEKALKETRPRFLASLDGQYRPTTGSSGKTATTSSSHTSMKTGRSRPTTIGSKAFGVSRAWRAFVMRFTDCPSNLSSGSSAFPSFPIPSSGTGKDYGFRNPCRASRFMAAFLQGRPHPLVGDAHPGYWENLYANTMRYEIDAGRGRIEVVDMYFNRDGSVTDGGGTVSGAWWIEGAEGQGQNMCYAVTGVNGIERELTQCFALAAMYDPRIGARWPGAFKEGVAYWAEVVEGRNS